MIKKLIFMILLIVHNAVCGIESHKEQDAKNAMTTKLVKEAIQFIAKQKTIEDTYDTFLSDPSWRSGDLTITIIDAQGTILIDCNDSSRIYSKVTNLDVLEKIAKNGGGWNRIAVNNRLFSQYVETIKTQEGMFFITSGYFAFSTEDSVFHAIEQIVRYYEENGIEKTIEYVQSKETVFDKTNPFICTMDGICKAYHDHPGLVNMNLFGQQLSTEQPLIKTITEVLKSPWEGNAPLGEGWVEYLFNNEKKRSFFHLLGKDYFVGAGYFPDIKKESLVDIVQQARSFLLSNGSEIAFKEFKKKDGLFVRGFMEVMVMDTQGNILIAPLNKELVGTNVMEKQDERGIYYFKDLMNKISDDETAWITYIAEATNWFMFAERVETPDGTFILMSQYHPDSKEEVVKSLLKNGIDYFNKSETNSGQTFKAFVNNPAFNIGDLSLFVFDMDGNCLANGMNFDLIHQNFYTFEDQNGTPMVSDIINTANMEEESWLTFTLQNAKRKILFGRVFEAQPTIINDFEFYRSFVIGCGYYL